MLKEPIITSTIRTIELVTLLPLAYQVWGERFICCQMYLSHRQARIVKSLAAWPSEAMGKIHFSFLFCLITFVNIGQEERESEDYEDP